MTSAPHGSVPRRRQLFDGEVCPTATYESHNRFKCDNAAAFAGAGDQAAVLAALAQWPILRDGHGPISVQRSPWSNAVRSAGLPDLPLRPAPRYPWYAVWRTATTHPSLPRVLRALRAAHASAELARDDD